MTMQREDVDALCAPIEKIVNYEYSSRDALIHNCDLGAIDMGQLQDLCAALRALLAERDAAYTQGYSDAEAEISQTAMGQKIEALSKQNAEYRAHVKRLTAERDAAFAAGQESMRERAAQEQEDCWRHGVPSVEHAKHIRALPINPRP